MDELSSIELVFNIQGDTGDTVNLLEAIQRGDLYVRVGQCDYRVENAYGGPMDADNAIAAPIEYAPPKPTRYADVGDKLKYWKTGVETTITRIDGRDIYTEYSTEIPDDALDLQNLDGEFLVWMNGRYEYSDIPF